MKKKLTRQSFIELTDTQAVISNDLKEEIKKYFSLKKDVPFVYQKSPGEVGYYEIATFFEVFLKHRYNHHLIDIYDSAWRSCLALDGLYNHVFIDFLTNINKVFLAEEEGLS